MSSKFDSPQLITGVVLAGGRGQRMGGVDKGLQGFRRKPLVQHVLERLSPQVGTILINANRHRAEYTQWGHAVIPDEDESFSGPLAGMLASLGHCQTPWLISVPCDTPFFPSDLVERLLQEAQSTGAQMAVPCTLSSDSRPQWESVFLLMRTDLREALRLHLNRGERKIETWIRSQPHVAVPFEDPSAFTNLNTFDDLRSLDVP